MATIEEKIHLQRARMLAGRTKEIDEFKSMIMGDSPQYNLLHYVAVGGMGKSSLLILLGEECDRAEVATATLDATEYQMPVAAAMSLLRQLGGARGPDPGQNIVERYKDIEVKLRQDRQVDPAAVDQMSMLELLVESSESSETGGERHWDHSLDVDGVRQVLSDDDFEFFSNPLPVVSDELATLLGEGRERTCIMVDTLEQATDSFERWLATLLMRLGEQVVLVSAGRMHLREQWDEYAPVSRTVELGELSEAEARQLLALRDISDAASVDRILDLAGGHPLALTICAESVASGLNLAPGEGGHTSVVEAVTQSLLDGLDEDLADLLVLCCSLRWFNGEILSIFDDRFATDELLEGIRRFPFVRQHSRGLAIHDRVRDFVNDDLRRRLPTKAQEIHRQAVTYFEGAHGRPAGLSEFELLAERIYHQILADEHGGLKEAARHFNDAADAFQASRCDLLHALIRDLPISESNQVWVDYFAGVTAKLMVDSQEADRRLRIVLNGAPSDLNSDLRVYAGRWLAGSLWFAGEFDEVIAVAEETRALSRQLADEGVPGMREYEHRALETIGLAHDRLGDFGVGIELMSDLIQSSREHQDRRGEGWGLLSRGYFSWHAGDWDAALRNLNECLGIARELGSDYMELYPLGHLGLINAHLGRYDSSYFPTSAQLLKECKDKALRASSREMDSKASQNLAQMSYLKGEFDAAREHVGEALERAEAMGHPYYVSDCLRIAGAIELACGELDLADEHASKSLAVAERLSARYLVARGHLALVEIAINRLKGGGSAGGSEHLLHRVEKVVELGSEFPMIGAWAHGLAVEADGFFGEPIPSGRVALALRMAIRCNRFVTRDLADFLVRCLDRYWASSWNRVVPEQLDDAIFRGAGAADSSADRHETELRNASAQVCMEPLTVVLSALTGAA